MKLKKSLIWFLTVLLLAAVLFCEMFFWYLPQYLKEKGPVSVPVKTDGGIRMMSCNLRCLSPLDLGEKSWFFRAKYITEDIVQQAPGIIGFQEATQWQYDYLVESLPEYDSVITYRDDSFASEGCPIFYNTLLYTLVDKGSFWLSETPEVMSKGWDAAHHRICSYVILTEIQSGKQFVVFNTHLDHVSEEARIKGIEVVLDKIRQFGGLPAVIMGDLNAEEDSETYRSVTQNFLDARYETENSSGSYTYQGWGDLENARRIDYFMISQLGFTVTGYTVLPGHRDGVYSSDHCPILLDVTLDGIRMMSHNLRCLSDADQGEKNWSVRSALIFEDIRDQEPGVIGFQEVTQQQYADLIKMLPEYDSVITYRDDTPSSEGCPIFYDASLYTLVDEGFFWLSETPEVMSKGWGAAYYRICSYVVLTDSQSGRDFAVFNIHLDNISEEARLEGIGVVLEKISQFSSLPTVIMGDFNATEDSETYARVTEDFLDARYETEYTSDSYTYQNWGNLQKARRIDYVMISKTGFRVARYNVLSGFRDGIYSSDHCPVVVDLTIHE